MKAGVDHEVPTADPHAWDGGGHPSPEVRTVFAVEPDRLSEDLRARVAAHVAACPECGEQHAAAVAAGYRLVED